MEMNELNILTDEQLIKMSQEGSETAEEILIEKYKGFVRQKAAKYYIEGAETEDVVQEGMIGFFKAVRSFDLEGPVKFKAYADRCITNRISDAIKHSLTQKSQTLNSSLSLDKTIGDENLTLGETLLAPDDSEPESQVLATELYKVLADNTENLFSEFECNVLRLRQEALSNTEIAERLGKSKKQIDNTIQRIRRKIFAYLEE